MTAIAATYPLRIARVTREPGDALVVTFEVPAALAKTFAFKPGQHLALTAAVGGETLRRTYSICSGPGEPMRIAIKRVEGGRFSAWAHAQLHAGVTINVAPPSGRFVLPPSDGSPRRIVAFAAGSGITPILGIIRQALEHERATRVTLVYANRSRDTVIFGEELEALKDKHLGRFEYVSVYSLSGEVESPLFEGRINADKVRALGASLIKYQDAARIYLCGPGDMIKACRDTLMATGVPREAIVHEFFVAPGSAPKATPTPIATVPPTAAGRAVTVILDGVRHRLSLAPGETVLAAALKAGVKAPYACAGGMCSTCRARIVHGSATMLLNYSLEPWEIEKGFTLACQAVPTSDTLTLDWDAM